MNQSYRDLIKKGQPLAGGLRKKNFLVKLPSGKKAVLALWPLNSLPKKKIISSIKWANLAKKKGLPTRNWHKFGKSWLRKIKYQGKDYWLGQGDYLKGEVSKTWTKVHFYQAGQALAQLHLAFEKKKRTLLHLDFARGNLLFDAQGKLSGLLDFEEAGWGEVEKDLGCCFSFLTTDSPQFKKKAIFETFLTAYQKKGGKFDYAKIEKHYSNFLKMRTRENDPQAFLRLAKKNLKNYQKQVSAKLLSLNGLKKLASKNRKKKAVITFGAYELLHWGHLEYLQKARLEGELLVVGVASNESRRRLKGKPYPLMSERTRAETLAHFPFVDAVTVVDEEAVSKELRALKPQVLFTVKKDWRENLRKKEEEALVESWGGKVKKVNYLSPNLSSSGLVEKVAFLKINQVINHRGQREPLLKFKKGQKLKKEIKFEKLAALEKKLRREKKTIAFTSLTADLFHLGHARFIQKAKSLVDVLVVGVPSNQSVRALKGLGRPIIDEKARALVLAYLPWVDQVVVFDERTILGCLKRLKPDVFFTVKDDWNTGFLNSPEARFMKSIQGKIVRSGRMAPYLSSSKMIEKAAGELVNQKFDSLINTAKQTPVLDADTDTFDPHGSQAQLAAREKGFYQKVLASVAKRGKCVFCDLKKKYLVAEKSGVVLTVALFPYLDGHLLIVPKRHVEKLAQLNEKEQKAVFALTKKGQRLLESKMGISNSWLLLREGEGIKAGKTVNHLHFHLLPYDPGVIKMGEKELSLSPLQLARKLRKKN